LPNAVLGADKARRSALVLDVDWQSAGGELRPPVFGLGRVGGEEKLSSDDGVG
jgi:hypothetical protein